MKTLSLCACVKVTRLLHGKRCVDVIFPNDIILELSSRNIHCIPNCVAMLHQTPRLRSLVSRISIREPLKNNLGVVYLASRNMGSELGSGSGKGGGGGGSVREAGGSLGKKGAAQEEAYFANQNKAMKDKLKDHLKDEIKKHEEAIKASKELMKEIEK